MISTKKIWVIIFFFTIIQGARADTFSTTQTYFNKWAQKNEIIGAALAVNDKTYFYGYSNKELVAPVNIQTKFGIGSITKTFVSVILLKLEAEGKLDIHDHITKYLPQYSKLKGVTIQALMQMTAGFNDGADDSVSPVQQVDLAYAKYDPKSAGVWLYSNASYQLLGILVEKITHRSLADAVSLFITSPLYLNSIKFPGSKQAASLKEYQNGQIKSSNFKNIYAAGGLVSSAHDLEKFIRHLFVIRDLLPPKQYAELTTFVKTPTKYYEFTGTKAPQFGLGVFKWNIPPYGDVLSYPGVLGEGFTSSYTVIGDNVIISQSNTYNNNDFTILWVHQTFTKWLIKNLLSQEKLA